MFEIYTRPDYKKIISTMLQDWEKLNLPPVDKDKLNIKPLPFRKIGLHSLLNFMLFSESQPFLVIKMPRYQEGKLAFAALENEAHTINYLNQKKILQGHLPQVYKLLDLEGVPILLLKAYHGEMLHHFLDKEEDLSNLDGLISSGAELLPHLHYQLESKEETINEAFIQKYIEEPLKLIVEYYPQHINGVEKFLSDFFKEKNFLNMKYPSVCLHREFNPWNLLREENGNLIILDWEDAMPEGLPLLDVYNYYTVCYRILFIGETKYAQERSFGEKVKRVDVLLKNYSSFIERYCKNLNISAGLKDFFFIIFAINSTYFFIEEKRREINYARSWLSLLLNTSFPNCFENHVRKEMEIYRSQKENE